MNKQELITRNQGVKLYDLSEPIDMHRMNMNLAYCSKKSKDPSFKLIAPFGHPLKYKSDFYYFESENTPISDQILEEMRFEYLNNNEIWIKYIASIRIVIVFSLNLDPLLTINGHVKNLNANQLYQLIELLK